MTESFLESKCPRVQPLEGEGGSADDEPVGVVRADTANETVTYARRHESIDSGGPNGNQPAASSEALDSNRVLERLAEGLHQHPQLLEQYAALSERLRMASAAASPEAPPVAAARKRTRDKLTMTALKVRLERRVELVERLVEARAERVWEECLEKRPWLQPLETWVLEKHKARIKQREGRGYNSDSELDGAKGKGPHVKRKVREARG